MAEYKPAFINTMKYERSGKPYPVYCDVKGDKGGATNSGITLTTLKDIGWKFGYHPPITKDTLRTLPEAIIQKIYEIEYWRLIYNKVEDQAIANYVFDMSVHHGCSRSHKIVQECCELKEDGVFGAATLKAVNEAQGLLDKLREAREAFFRWIVEKEPSQEKFIEGWLMRARQA